jgi:hypothetical protein
VTYVGFAHRVVIEHLQMLGVTAVELMPIHQLAKHWLLGSVYWCRTTGIARGQTLADPREEASPSVQGRSSAYEA